MADQFMLEMWVKQKSSISDQKTNLTVFAKPLLDWTKHGHWLGINQLKMVGT